MDQLLSNLPIWLIPAVLVSSGAGLVMWSVHNLRITQGVDGKTAFDDDLLRANIFAVLAVGQFLLVFFIGVRGSAEYNAWSVFIAVSVAIILGIVAARCLRPAIYAERAQVRAKSEHH